MRPAALAHRERGFSLPEVLCALALFAIVVTALLGYHRVLQQGFISQWQVRQMWRLAREQTEPEVPLPQMPWKVRQQQTSSLGCVSIGVTVTGPQGRTAELSRLDCPRPEQRQE
ncbi:prepilin-type N-terminal cleavage/methylation domain-containing protein [Cedecea davisae]|uniref:Prepilin-type N-terminal cleavage/methylation domain-containing protein n=1 Tax=Cedecea davisae TaxID=158484 RepID=A0ABS6DCS1_9ENTR|nr:prepilin-type N-terminal cleavage/methylation domain-containing protein [Cedecea davisae]MBU4680654.1 prepilin-type N-terminal cleavage/methylation domain-containing protein [Cedecea davisae]MBU4685682.1 prepilin-type N-terminal cleavage/methylation domain-containing protein [Cedecea davisae]